MNKGLLRGTTHGRGDERSRRPLIYVPFQSFIDAFPYYIADGGTDAYRTATADILMSYTPPLKKELRAYSVAYFGNGNVPDGRVRALQVKLFLQTSVVAANTALYIHDYDDTNNPLGATTNGNGPGIYGGKVASHWEEGEGMVYTGGIDGTQFKYNVNWVAGTVTFILRVIGYYVEG